MSSLFSGGPRRRDGRDQDLVDAAERRQRAFARDIGDESALARGNEPRYRRPGRWLFAFLGIVVVIGGFRAFQHSDDGPPLTRSCTKPALAISTNPVKAGKSIRWSGTGPQSGRYVLLFEGDPKSSSNAFTMTDCHTHGTIKVPTAEGTHTLRLFHRTNGKFTLVAHVAVTVN